MNANQAKQIKLADLMERIGFQVKKVERGRTEHKYLSPFRSEAEPSFNVNLAKNSWFDFGESEGGNTLDFAIKFLRTSGKPCRVSDALSWLESTMGSPQSFQGGRVGGNHKHQADFFSFSQQIPVNFTDSILPNIEADRDLEFVKEAPLTSSLVLSYLEGRGVPRVFAQKYLRLIHYRNKQRPSERPYFAFGMKNRGGGYEIRSASDDPKLIFKSALIVRDITFVPGKQGGGVVNLFEGQLDFLSLLVMLRVDCLSGDSIILNGLQSYGLAKAHIEEQGYGIINTFLDNNAPGQSRTQDFIADFGHKVVNHSTKFQPHVDLNDALRAGDIPVFSEPPAPPLP
ncbi:MAG: hypothetical protein GC192_21255 [Bacteroidetes bacterium]|nr:hypothetical protein [Bacteroidota bacterium]